MKLGTHWGLVIQYMYCVTIHVIRYKSTLQCVPSLIYRWQVFSTNLLNSFYNKQAYCKQTAHCSKFSSHFSSGTSDENVIIIIIIIIMLIV